jgi:dipeptidyl aminopeptidase/acylaminoacyl peptidase
VLYYPTDYEPGKKYPTILHLYEQFFDDEYEPTDKLLLAGGYVIVRPSVPSKADPGFVSEAWSKGANAAANKLIEMGLADSARMGVYGCSYGGFSTSLLITQTRRFKAAVSVAGPIDLVSFYTGSPRLGMRNMAFSEAKGTYQLNMGATLWQQPQKYLQNSALMFADRITTPLLILSGGQDHNVPVPQSEEMFYGMRRLGKDVEWVNYANGGHCMPYSSEEDFRDYNRRIVEWFDRHLKKPVTRASTGG